MPELPEVQTVVSGLNRILPGKKISEVEILWRGTIATPAPEIFAKKLQGRTISRLERRAKFIVIVFRDNSVLLVHLRMSGQLFFRKSSQQISGGNSFLRVRITFADGTLLDFNDARKFGKMYWYKTRREAEEGLLHKLGVEPLKVSENKFSQIFQKKKGGIKANLLRQDLIAGIGNIYADEALFAARIHPLSQTHKIPPMKLKKLHSEIQRILREAIHLRGTTMRSYTDVNGRSGQFWKFLKIYHQHNRVCPNCGSIIKKLKVAGRGTHICEKCQKRY